MPKNNKQKGKQPKQYTTAPVAQNISSGGSSSRTIEREVEVERVFTVPGSVNYTVQTQIYLNPGLAASFPYLSGIAAKKERYRIHKLRVRYKNLKGSSSPGNVILAYEPNVQDAAPSTATLLTQSDCWKDGAPWRVFELTVPVINRELFTRTGNLPMNSDAKTYDAGKIIVATEGCADTTDHGYIELDYDISLSRKQPLTTRAVASDIVAQYNNSADQQYVGAVAGNIVCDEVINETTAVLSKTVSSWVLAEGLYLVMVEVEFAATGGPCQLDCSLNHNGALSPPCNAVCDVAVNEYNRFMVTRIVNSDGVNSIGFYITNSANTATLPQDKCRITFQRI